MKQFEKYVAIKECPTHNDEYMISYIDYNTIIPQSSQIIPQSSQISSPLYTVETKLRKINISEIKKLIVNKIVELSKKNDSVKLSLKNSKYKINSKIREASYNIAIEGRFGEANRMLISTYNYNKYFFKNVFIHTGIEIIFDDSVTDIIIYRKNEPDQPGIILIHNKEMYDILSIGLYPEKHYVRIECDYRLKKLKRILK